MDPNQIADLVGERENMEDRVIVPESLYPVRVRVVETGSSAKKGTPYVGVALTVTKGPYQGFELKGFDAQVWVSGKTLDFVRHLVKGVTGKEPVFSALAEFGLEANGVSDRKAFREMTAEWWESLDTDTKLEFAAQFARFEEWGDKECICHIKQEEDTYERDGERRTVTRNKIASFYPMNDKSNGLAIVERTHFPLQQKYLEG